MPNMEDFRMSIHHTGEVAYNFPSVVSIACKMNVAYFPYDHQVCSLTFGSWSYSSKYIKMVQDGNLDTSFYVQHNEWEVVETAVVNHSKFYDCCPDSYDDVTFHIHIRRKPLFYMITVVMPCVMINLLTATGFKLPTFSGEKIALQVTIFLSLTVYLLLVQDILPSSSENFPWLAIYFAVSMTLICVACAFSSCVLYLHHRSSQDNHMSSNFRFIFRTIVRKIFCFRSKAMINFDNLKIVQVRSSWKLKRHPKIFERAEYSNLSANREEELEDRTTSEWTLFAKVMNLLFMFVYVYAAFVNIVVFLSVTIGHYEKVQVKMD
jgi:hypothetical protein